MNKMIVVEYMEGATEVTLLCPSCGTISKHKLKAPYIRGHNNELLSPHTCTVCREVYTVCHSNGFSDWQPQIKDYMSAPDEYNKSVREQYASQSNIERKIARWQRNLLDTSKRNKMINYRESKRQTLRILEPDAATLFNRLAVDDKTLVFQRPLSKNSDVRTYSVLSLLETLGHSMTINTGDIMAEGTVIEREKTLKNLRAKTKLAQEEQGTNILYLSFGFIQWRENNTDSSPWVKSPLLLMPVELSIKSLNAPYTISKHDEEIEVNPTLDHLFNQDYGIDLPTFDLKNKSSFNEYLEQIEKIVDQKGWKLIREVSLGLLSFLKISMYHDLEENKGQILNNPVIKAISGDLSALKEIPAGIINYNFDDADPKEWHEVIDADSSQEEAILLSKQGISFVMQGPPGTGKSQTITNIIAEALGDGKKVLFVSEKAAALQVVLKRLTDVGLNDFCLALHNYKANKKEIIDNIGANLDLSKAYVANTDMAKLERLLHDRQFLDKYVNELHQIVEPFGESVYMVLGKLEYLSHTTNINSLIKDVGSVSNADFSSMAYVVEAFEKALNNISGELTDNPWWRTAATNSGQDFKREFLNLTSKLPDNLEYLAFLVDTVNQEYACKLTATWNSLTENVGNYEAVLELPLFPVAWKDNTIRNILKEKAISEGKKTSKEKDHVKNVGLYNKYFDSKWDTKGLSLSCDNLKQLAADEIYKEIVSDDSTLADSNEKIISLIDNLQDKIEKIIINYQNAIELLGVSFEDSFADIFAIEGIITIIKKRPVLMKGWFDLKTNSLIVGLAEEAYSHQHEYLLLQQQILENWEKTILNIDTDAMLLRFKTQYTSDFCCAQEKMNQDLSYFRTMYREVGVDFETKDLINVLQDLLDIDTEKTWFEDNNHRFNTIMPKFYQGPDTDWDNVQYSINKIMDSAIEHQNRFQKITNQVLENWEPEIFNIDAHGMLNRFKVEYTGFLRRFKSNYKNDIKQLKILSKSIGIQLDDSQVIAILQKLNEIRTEKNLFNEDIKKIKDILPSYSLDEDTDLQYIINDVSQMIIEAKGHSIALKGKTDNILKKWDSGIFELEPRETLSRFRDGYTEAYRITNEQYENDMSSLMAHSKHVGEVIGHDAAKTLLLNIDALNHEKKWYDDNKNRLGVIFKAKYAGLDTDWDSIIAGIKSAAEISQQLKGKGPLDIVVQNIIDTVDNQEKLQQLDRISDIFGEISVAECEKNINSLFSKEVSKYSSLKNDVINMLIERKSIEEQHGKYIETLDLASKTGNLHWEDLTELSKNVEELFGEVRWFMTNTEQFSNTVESDDTISLVVDYGAEILEHYYKGEEYQLSADLVKLFGERYIGLETDWDGIVKDIDAISEFAMKPFFEDVSEYIDAVSNDKAKRTMARDAFLRIHELLESTSEGMDFFAGLFPASKMKDMVFHKVVEKYNVCINQYDDLSKWLDVVETKKSCDEKGLSEFTYEIIRRNNNVRDVKKAFEKNFYFQWLNHHINKFPSIRDFKRRNHEQYLDDFRKYDSLQFAISKRRIRNKIIGSFPNEYSMTNSSSEQSTLQREMSKKRRIMPLRQLFHKIPSLLLRLKPCLMMSPLSVAHFLNAEDYHFDMVIFDEASQIFPQDAIGAIFRADQTIIAGDTMQLPPTNFFSASTSNNDDFDDDNDNEEEYEDETYDSILEETATVLPNKMLQWHYRSKNEQLITFSNKEIYNNKLVTFPSNNEKTKDSGVEFVYVEDGYYVGGGKNCNVPEAKKCVELVKKHIEQHPNRSLGIIAFSEKQQQAIASEIQRFREQNPKYESFFTEDKEDEFFIKNLENVQGDERDTIIFSICYAKTLEQKNTGKPMTMRFGPLGIAGGERRLNVAVTRAKTNIKLVSSIMPSDIDLNRTNSVGVAMLRSYIEFAINGGAVINNSVHNKIPDDFVDAIYNVVIEQGFKAKKYVGCSSCQIDIAIEHPTIAENYIVGIECDGISYSSAKTARDRDRLRNSVLQNMGWNLYRIWSTEWYKNPELEKAKLIRHINQALTRAKGE